MLYLNDLNFETVPAFYKDRASYYSDSEADLSGASTVDSAGVAFLVMWAKNLPQRRLTLKNVPDKALALIRTFKVGELFNIEE